MASLGSITINNQEILVIDADPVSNPTPAPVGSLAMLNTGGGIYYKYGSNDTDWSLLQPDANTPLYSPNRVRLFDDFVYNSATSGSIGELGWLRSSTGIINNTGTGLTAAVSGQAFGYYGLGTSSTSAVNSLYLNSGFYYNNGPIRFKTRVLITAYSNATNTFAIEFGIISNLNNTTNTVLPINAVYFSISDSSPQYFSINTANATTRTSLVTSQLISLNTWYNLECIYNPYSPTSGAQFYINNVLVGTITTNLPVLNSAARFGFKVRKLAGSAARYVYIDYAMVEKVFTTSRG